MAVINQLAYQILPARRRTHALRSLSRLRRQQAHYFIISTLQSARHRVEHDLALRIHQTPLELTHDEFEGTAMRKTPPGQWAHNEINSIKGQLPTDIKLGTGTTEY